MHAVRQDTPFLYQGPEMCIICREDLDNTYVWAHQDSEGSGGYEHPIHEECREEILNDSPASYACCLCQIPRAITPSTPIREGYDPTIKILYDYPKNKLPKEILSDLRSHKIEILKEGIFYGMAVDNLCFIASRIFLTWAKDSLLPILPFHSETNKIIIIALVIQVQFLPPTLMCYDILAYQSYTKRPPSTPGLNREIAKTYKEEMRILYIASFILGMIISIGENLYLTTSEDAFIPLLITFLAIPIGTSLFLYKFINTKA